MKVIDKFKLDLFKKGTIVKIAIDKKDWWFCKGEKVVITDIDKLYGKTHYLVEKIHCGLHGDIFGRYDYVTLDEIQILNPEDMRSLKCYQCPNEGGSVTDNGWEICECQKINTKTNKFKGYDLTNEKVRWYSYVASCGGVYDKKGICLGNYIAGDFLLQGQHNK